MAKLHLDPPLSPRNGHTLMVLDVERISTDHQDLKSLDEQRLYVRAWVTDRYDGKVVFESIAGRASGEELDRKDLRLLEEKIESDTYDLVIAEDLGRICRRNKATEYCEIAEDHGTRLVGVNDNLDTGQEGWETNAFFASFRHGLYNKDTSKRIRRSLRGRFAGGGVVQTFPFGYFKPQHCTSDSDVKKIPTAEPIYGEWFRILEHGGSFSEVADFLNSNAVPVGKWCRSKRWTPQMVARVTHNPILKGIRVRNRKMSKRINKTGRRKSVDAPPDERLERHCPHLQFVEPDKYDRIIRQLDQRNAKYRRGQKRAIDQRKGVPRKRTVWPGQSMYCGICGAMLYYGAHGNMEHLMCSGAIRYRCWNGASISGHDTAVRICTEVWSLIQKLPAFDANLIDEVTAGLALSDLDRQSRRQAIQAQVGKLSRERENLLAAIRQGRAVEILTAELDRIATESLQLSSELQELDNTRPVSPVLPSIDVLRNRAQSIFVELSRESPEFGRELNRLITGLTVFPVRLIDGGKIGMQAELSLDLSQLSHDTASWPEEMKKVLRMPIVVDLFWPPQRVQHMAEIMRLSEASSADVSKLTERQIAARLGIKQPTVQRSKKLYREMVARGLASPYVRLTAPPEDGSKLRRHKHKRFGSSDEKAA